MESLNCNLEIFLKKLSCKRKIIVTISFSLSLLFGREEVSSSQSPNSNFYKQTISERVNERNINLFEEKSQQVILVKSEGNPLSPHTHRGPSNFPTPPSRGRRPSRPLTKVNPFRHLDVNPGTGANPGGAGDAGAANYDDESGIPKVL